jgi:hypothetical protein
MDHTHTHTHTLLSRPKNVARFGRDRDGRDSLPSFHNRNIILPIILYGCETWSLTLREERRLRVSENRVLRRIFGPREG